MTNAQDTSLQTLVWNDHPGCTTSMLENSIDNNCSNINNNSSLFMFSYPSFPPSDHQEDDVDSDLDPYAPLSIHEGIPLTKQTQSSPFFSLPLLSQMMSEPHQYQQQHRFAMMGDKCDFTSMGHSSDNGTASFPTIVTCPDLASMRSSSDHGHSQPLQHTFMPSYTDNSNNTRTPSECTSSTHNASIFMSNYINHHQQQYPYTTLNYSNNNSYQNSSNNHSPPMMAPSTTKALMYAQQLSLSSSLPMILNHNLTANNNNNNSNDSVVVHGGPFLQDNSDLPPVAVGDSSADSLSDWEEDEDDTDSSKQQQQQQEQLQEEVNSTTGSIIPKDRFKPFHEEKWYQRYQELCHFRREHGHSAVPHTYPPHPQLARWVKRQRRQYKLLLEGKATTMTNERLDLLKDVDFVWDSHDVNWREKLDALDVFYRAKGHVNVPSNYSDKKLATWVKCQRRQYKLYRDGKQSAMCPERIAELEQRGFEWEIRPTGARNTTGTVLLSLQSSFPLLYEAISEM
jgi:hypothetical protein